MRNAILKVTLLLALLLLSAFIAMQSAGAIAGQFVATVTVDGHDAQAASAGEPMLLYPDKSLDIMIEVTNHGPAPVTVRQVEFTGRVLGLAFFSYATPRDVTVLPGKTEKLRYRLDLTGLSGLATGLIGAEFVIK